MYNLPELLTLNSGLTAETEKDFKKRKNELIDILSENIYGKIPEIVGSRYCICEKNEKCCSGNAVMEEGIIQCDIGQSGFSFPIKLVTPTKPGKKTLIILINFDESIYCKYLPLEEIIDNDFALAYIWYQDVATDDDDFSGKLSSFFDRSARHAPGKISFWAWAVSETAQALSTHERIDSEEIAVIGHSRLGKTALWCGANDERIKYICSNDSGCMGAALEKFKHEGGETLNDIYDRFPYWFCPEIKEHYGKTDEMAFDQHFLLGACAPRYVMINSAGDDLWADPVAEQQTCIEATPAWKLFGKDGYLGKSEPYSDNSGCLEGDIGYYKRSGIHFLGRKDWQNFMAFIRSKQR